MTYSKGLTALSLALAISLTSCEKEGDTTPAVTFNEVNSILQANCQPCHVAGSGTNFEQRAKFVDDASIAKAVASGIISRVNRDPGQAGFMPVNGSKLAAADIQVIQDWIDGGMK
ncbi:hypothetical protein [Jiulongibacter sp. NS-SX5]|uniref:hypothetical protein n=1 Tax=Jiulongibacter sp. NS-SX5 TaxID=3463854 RepID=UPI0040584D0D